MNTPASRGSTSGLDSLQQKKTMGSSLGLERKIILQDECSLWGVVDSKVSEPSAKTVSGE